MFKVLRLNFWWFSKARFWVMLSQNSHRNKLSNMFNCEFTKNTKYFLWKMLQNMYMFPKNENAPILRFRYISSNPAATFLCGQVHYFVNLHRPTYQESTPTSNIARLILCSRQAIVPLCRPGGVRAARFNKKKDLFLNGVGLQDFALQHIVTLAGGESVLGPWRQAWPCRWF